MGVKRRVFMSLTHDTYLESAEQRQMGDRPARDRCRLRTPHVLPSCPFSLCGNGSSRSPLDGRQSKGDRRWRRWGVHDRIPAVEVRRRRPCE
jgi:hypothetical protein